MRLFAQMQEMNRINLYDTINEESVRAVVDSLNNSSGDVNLHIHSPGGSVMDGILLINHINRYHKGKITAVIDGLCASMATFIAMSCGKVEMASNAFYMIHAPSTAKWGKSGDFDSTLKLLKDIEAECIRSLQVKTGKPKADLLHYMDGKDYWMTAEEAKTAGFVDEVLEPNEQAKGFNKTKAIAQTENIVTNFLNNKRENNMKDIKMVLELPDDSTESVIVDRLQNQAELIKKLQGEVLAYEKKEQAQLEATKTALLDGAVSDKKITLKEKAVLSKLDIDSLETLLAERVGVPSIASQVKEDIQELLSLRTAWTFNDWSKKDPQGLGRLRTECAEVYQKLLHKIN